MKNWQIFTGQLVQHNDLEHLPPAPSWRPFAPGQKPIFDESSWGQQRSALDKIDQHDRRGPTFRVDHAMIQAVNAALYLRRPLLLTGKPGTGKSSLIYAVAHELNMGPVLRWSVTSRTTLKEGLYQYDALGRLHQQEIDKQRATLGDFIQLGPLGTALLPTTWPRALLIDEIDKSDIDLPNDLLSIFEEGEFPIPELARANEPEIYVRTWKNMGSFPIQNGLVRCKQFPLVVLSSNAEREFPPAFLRRCIRLHIQQPSESMLAEIVEAHLGLDTRLDAMKLIMDFAGRRGKEELATDQLLNIVFLLSMDNGITDEEQLRELVLKQLTTIEAT